MKAGTIIRLLGAAAAMAPSAGPAATCLFDLTGATAAATSPVAPFGTIHQPRSSGSHALATRAAAGAGHASWAMMLVGFAVIGAATRGRRPAVTFG